MLLIVDFRIYEGIVFNINFENILGIIYEGFFYFEKLEYWFLLRDVDIKFELCLVIIFIMFI